MGFPPWCFRGQSSVPPEDPEGLPVPDVLRKKQALLMISKGYPGRSISSAYSKCDGSHGRSNVSRRFPCVCLFIGKVTMDRNELNTTHQNTYGSALHAPTRKRIKLTNQCVLSQKKSNREWIQSAHDWLHLKPAIISVCLDDLRIFLSWECVEGDLKHVPSLFFVVADHVYDQPDSHTVTLR